jgi:hypothetical protein
MSEPPDGKPILPAEKPILDEPPPFLGTWPRVYRVILIYLAAVIFLFWLFTRHYAPPQN